MNAEEVATVEAVTAKLTGNLFVGARVQYRATNKLGTVVHASRQPPGGNFMDGYWTVRWDADKDTIGPGNPYHECELQLA